MAVAAIDAVARDMALVAELNRLIACDVRLGHPRGAIDLVEQAEQRDDREYGAEDADPGDGVGAALEDLRHRVARSRGIAHRCVANRKPTVITEEAAEEGWKIWAPRGSNPGHRD